MKKGATNESAQLLLAFEQANAHMLALSQLEQAHA